MLVNSAFESVHLPSWLSDPNICAYYSCRELDSAYTVVVWVGNIKASICPAVHHMIELDHGHSFSLPNSKSDRVAKQCIFPYCICITLDWSNQSIYTSCINSKVSCLSWNLSHLMDIFFEYDGYECQQHTPCRHCQSLLPLDTWSKQNIEHDERLFFLILHSC